MITFSPGLLYCYVLSNLNLLKKHINIYFFKPKTDYILKEC